MELYFEVFDPTKNLPQQRELFKDCFPETVGDTIQEKEHYYWKFHSYPTVTEKSWEYASYLNMDMVGYYAALPYQYKIGNKIVTIGMVCDVMTSSRYRGQGIFTRMGNYATGELSRFVPFVTGYPIRKEVIPGHLKVGWKIAFQMPLYIKFIRLNSFFKSKKIPFFLSPVANTCLSLYNSIVHMHVRSEYTCEIKTNIEEIEDYDNFVNRWMDSIPNALVKDRKFASWRYSAPHRKYRFLIIRKGHELVAFLSFRNIIKEEVPSYGILDFMVLPSSRNCIGLVNKELSKLAKLEKIEAIMTMMSPRSAKYYSLYKNGFFRSPFVFNLIIKNLTGEFNDSTLFDEKNWHLMWVDSDDL